MIKDKIVAGIILMAGNSTRYGKNKNKNFEILNELKIMEYSLKAFNNNNYIDTIVIAVKKEEQKEVELIVGNYNIKKEIKIVTGGNSRCESVHNAIDSVNTDIVVIHDGARPMIKQKYINECVEKILEENTDGVTIGVKSKDTIKIVDDNGFVINTTNREKTWIIQTPQCFKREKLLQCYKKIDTFEGITDDCSILEKNDYKIKIIKGDYTNIKITTPEDLEVLKMFSENS